MADRLIELPDETATIRLAGEVAGSLQAGDVIALDGPLGAGKTTFARALVAALGGDPGLVASPTFTLLHRYDARLPVIHVDAYRLRSPGELRGLGFDELRDEAVAVVEWAERVAEVLTPTWSIRLDHAASAGGRVATVCQGRRILNV